MNTHRVSSAAYVQQLLPGATRARAFSGVVRFAPTPAYKLRRLKREWSFRVHASSEFVELTESEGGEV